MKRQKVNIIFVWLILMTVVQLSFGIKAATVQFQMDNSINIRDSAEEIVLVDSPNKTTQQVLILFVDGMRFDKMLEANTPTFDALIDNGVTFSNFRAVLPSYSKVNYAAMATGASTNISEVFSNAHKKELPLPTLYSIASQNNLSTGLVTTSSFWETLLGKDADIITKVETTKQKANSTGRTKEAALEAFTNNFTQLQFVGFYDVDKIGHIYGASSDKYREKIEEVDAAIGELLLSYETLGQLDNTTVVLFSDHGMDDRGGHGGESEQQTHASLVISGKGTRNPNTTITSRVCTNFITPTILAMLGLPVAPTMNGRIISETINSTSKTQAIYALQSAEIMVQQLETSNLKIKLLTARAKEFYSFFANELRTNLTNLKADYSTVTYEETLISAQNLEKTARKILSQLIQQRVINGELLRALSIIGLFTLGIFAIFFLHRFKIIQVTHQKVITKENSLPATAGAISAILVAVIIFLIFGFTYNANRFNSVQEPLIPNLLAFFMGTCCAIFIPWLVIFLQWKFAKDKRFGKQEGTKKQQPIEKHFKFRDFKEPFRKGSIGSICLLSVPIAVYIFYYIISYGPWPIFLVPICSEYYAYMIIGVLTSLLYIVAIILIIVQYVRNKQAIVN